MPVPRTNPHSPRCCKKFYSCTLNCVKSLICDIRWAVVTKCYEKNELNLLLNEASLMAWTVTVSIDTLITFWACCDLKSSLNKHNWQSDIVFCSEAENKTHIWLPQVANEGYCTWPGQQHTHIRDRQRWKEKCKHKFKSFIIIIIIIIILLLTMVNMCEGEKDAQIMLNYEMWELSNYQQTQDFISVSNIIKITHCDVVKYLYIICDQTRFHFPHNGFLDLVLRGRWQKGWEKVHFRNLWKCHTVWWHRRSKPTSCHHHCKSRLTGQILGLNVAMQHNNIVLADQCCLILQPAKTKRKWENQLAGEFGPTKQSKQWILPVLICILPGGEALWRPVRSLRSLPGSGRRSVTWIISLWVLLMNQLWPPAIIVAWLSMRCAYSPDWRHGQTNGQNRWIVSQREGLLLRALASVICVI